MTTILLAITVLTVSGHPVHNAWVRVEGMVETEFYQEHLTDSHGRFIAEVQPGSHTYSVMKDACSVSGNLELVDKDHADVVVVMTCLP
jgi:hypothetical protein